MKVTHISRSGTYDRMYKEFLNTTRLDFLAAYDNDHLVDTNVNLYIWHDAMPEGGYDLTPENRPALKRALLPEVATQFREGQMLPSIQFRWTKLARYLVLQLR